MNPDLPRGAGLFAIDTPDGPQISNVRRIAGAVCTVWPAVDRLALLFTTVRYA